MPTENKGTDPEFNLNRADGGRDYIAHLFKTVLKRHDYRQYITERLAGDFACDLAKHFEAIKARETALQQRLTAADERADALGSLVPEAELALKALNVAVSVYDVELADSARRGLRLIIAALKPTEGGGDDA